MCYASNKKLQTASDGMDLPNQDYKYSCILEANTIKQVKMKEKN